MSTLHFISCARTDTGLVRSHNEDAVLERPELGLWAVADGMGGHSAGDVASAMVVESLRCAADGEGLSALVDHLDHALGEVNASLRQLARERGTKTIGSTVAVLLARETHALCLWAGDSRIYRLRNGYLEQLSQDHALVTELLAHGAIDPEQARTHPHGNLITRAVGADDELHLDLEIFTLRDGDLFLLCSDGLDKEVQEQELRDMLSSHSVAEIPDALVELTLSRGARDNVSVVAVCADSRAVDSHSVTRDGSGLEPGEDTLPDFALQDDAGT
jgi:serine/threonine-protein phosphatase Stp1